MATVIDAVYERGVFRPIHKPEIPERQKVRLQVLATPPEEPEREWGTYESMKKTFEEMPKDAGIDDEEWAKFEAEQKAADLRDLEETAQETAKLLGQSDG